MLSGIPGFLGLTWVPKKFLQPDQGREGISAQGCTAGGPPLPLPHREARTILLNCYCRSPWHLFGQEWDSQGHRQLTPHWKIKKQKRQNRLVELPASPVPEVARLESCPGTIDHCRTWLQTKVSCDLISRRPINLDSASCGKCSWLPSPPRTEREIQWRRGRMGVPQ